MCRWIMSWMFTQTHTCPTARITCFRVTPYFSHPACRPSILKLGRMTHFDDWPEIRAAPRLWVERAKKWLGFQARLDSITSFLDFCFMLIFNKILWTVQDRTRQTLFPWLRQTALVQWCQGQEKRHSFLCSSHGYPAPHLNGANSTPQEPVERRENSGIRLLEAASLLYWWDVSKKIKTLRYPFSVYGYG